MAEATTGTGTKGIGRTVAGGRTVLAPSTSLTYENTEALKLAILASGEGHRPEAIIDCKSVAYMDSEALELLVDMHDELASRGGTLKLIELNEVCSDIMVVTRLANTLHIYKDLPAAMQTG